MIAVGNLSLGQWIEIKPRRREKWIFSFSSVQNGQDNADTRKNSFCFSLHQQQSGIFTINTRRVLIYSRRVSTRKRENTRPLLFFPGWNPPPPTTTFSYTYTSFSYTQFTVYLWWSSSSASGLYTARRTYLWVPCFQPCNYLYRTPAEKLARREKDPNLNRVDILLLLSFSFLLFSPLPWVFVSSETNLQSP